MTTPHPQADLLRAIADGKQMQQDFIEQGWTYIAQSSPAAKLSGLNELLAVTNGTGDTK